MQNNENITIEKVPQKFSIKFETLYSAIEYYITLCPTRQKSQTIEPQGGCKPSFSELDPNHPHRVWCGIAYAFTLLYTKLNRIEKMAYGYWMKRYPSEYGTKRVAEAEGVSEKDLARAIKYVKEALEDSLIDRDLMPLPDNWEPAQRNYIPTEYKAGRPRH